MSAEETQPLNPDETDRPSENDDDVSVEVEPLRQRQAMEQPSRPRNRDPLFILIPYALSFIVSLSGFCVGIAGYIITLTGPFDADSKKKHREGYESFFFGMRSVMFFLGINTLWTAFNFYLGLRGCQENLWIGNHVYDFLLWASLIAFSVLNMVEMLLAHESMCSSSSPDVDKTYHDCESWTLALLIVEMVAVNLGLLVAVIHFAMMIGRCCTHSNVKMKIREQIAEEEGYLMELQERRRELEDHLLLEAGKSLPALPVDADTDIDANEDVGEQTTGEPSRVEEENLIDMASEDPVRISTDSSEFTPYAAAETPARSSESSEFHPFVSADGQEGSNETETTTTQPKSP